MMNDGLGFRSASTAGVGGPKLPGVASPLVDLDGAVQVGLHVAGSGSSRA